MPTIADVLRRYGGQYLERFGATMPREHKKVLHAITACRTGELGTVLYVCQSCGEIHAIGRSCGNRHCPTCQHEKTKAWLEKQTDRLLPCPYFLVTFTLPAELRAGPKPSARCTPPCSRLPARRRAPWPRTRDLWAPIASASSVFCILGAGRWSITRTCTTWCRVAGSTRVAIAGCPPGLISSCRWRLCPSLPRQVPRHPGAREPASPGPPGGLAPRLGSTLAGRRRRPSLTAHLAPYVFRVAIGNRRIVSCEDGNVTFTYRRVGSKRLRKMSLDAMEFLAASSSTSCPPGSRRYGTTDS